MIAKSNLNQFFNLEKAAILLVDGDGFSANILGNILAGFGARNLARCDSMAAARALLVETKYHLLTLDPTSLEEDGYQLIHWLRRTRSKNRTAPVLVATGHTQRSQIAAARDSGVNFVMTKPLSPTKVYDRIVWIAREERAHIECPAYAGPERRFRSEGPPPGLEGRRAEDRFSQTSRQLTQSDIDAMMEPRRIEL